MHKSTCCRDQPLLTGSPKATCAVLICGVYRLCFLPALGEFSQLLVRTVIAQDDFAHPPNDRISRCAEPAEASGKSWTSCSRPSQRAMEAGRTFSAIADFDILDGSHIGGWDELLFRDRPYGSKRSLWCFRSLSLIQACIAISPGRDQSACAYKQLTHILELEPCSRPYCPASCRSRL